jgi:hypothetical protein
LKANADKGFLIRLFKRPAKLQAAFMDQRNKLIWIFDGIPDLKFLILGYRDDQFIFLTSYLNNLAADKPGLLQPFAAEPYGRKNGEAFFNSRKIFAADRKLSCYGAFGRLRVRMHDVVILYSKARQPVKNIQHGTIVYYPINHVGYRYFIREICILLYNKQLICP